MKNEITFHLGNLLLSPFAFLLMANNEFLNVLSVFYLLCLVFVGNVYFKTFWKRYFDYCISFDKFLKSQVSDND